MKGGFKLNTNCNYEGAATTGELLFENFSFADEDEALDNQKSGSLISTDSPFNITIRDSAFSIYHDETDLYDVFRLESSKSCILEDDVKQLVYFTNNTVSFSGDTKSNLANNFILEYSEINKRYKEIYVTYNTYVNMFEAAKTFMKISMESEGYAYLKDNIVTNCSSNAEIFEVSTTENIVIDNNMFNNVVLGE